MEEQQHQGEKKVKRFSLRLLVVLALFTMLLYAFAKITNETIFEKDTDFDERVFELTVTLKSEMLTKVMLFFTFFGSRLFLLPAYTFIVAYHLFYRKSSARSLGIAAVGFCGAGILFLLKNIFKRTRPIEPLIENITSFSYPSGHSFSAFTFCGMLIYLLWHVSTSNTLKWVGTLCLLMFALTVAFSRVYLHVHYASDVIAGFLLSSLWLYICYLVFIKITKAERTATTQESR